MIVYSTFRSPRLTYVISFLSGYYSHPFEITDDKEKFLASKEGRINYSAGHLSDTELQIIPQGLLEKRGIEDTDLAIGPSAGVPALFTNTSDTGFDIFSAIFYLLSRYEEYLPHNKDSYGRYAHTNSVAFREGFLHLPAVNLWLDTFAGKIRTFTHVTLSLPKFTFIPTYDIDIAWSYQSKGVLRNLGGLLRSVVKRDLGSLKERLAVLAGRSSDPFDSYEWMSAVHQEYQLKPVYFFHVGKSRSKYDKNIPPEDPQMQQLITSVSSQYAVGLHPSWKSGDAPEELREEKRSLEKIAGHPVTRSRQHYIRFTLPQTFRTLIQSGIEEDYSMGYGSINGFRASVAAPFYWYDLEKEEETSLLLHPFCFMDANSHYEQKQTPEEALRDMKAFHHILQHSGGQMIIIFHNNFLGSGTEFLGWKEMYQDFFASTR